MESHRIGHGSSGMRSWPTSAALVLVVRCAVGRWSACSAYICVATAAPDRFERWGNTVDSSGRGCPWNAHLSCLCSLFWKVYHVSCFLEELSGSIL
jgi:hypothetical protein